MLGDIDCTPRLHRWTVRGVCGAVSRCGRASGLPAANCNIRGAEQTRSFIEASGTKPIVDTNPHSLSRFSMHSTNTLPNVAHGLLGLLGLLGCIVCCTRSERWCVIESYSTLRYFTAHYGSITVQSIDKKKSISHGSHQIQHGWLRVANKPTQRTKSTHSHLW